MVKEELIKEKEDLRLKIQKLNEAFFKGEISKAHIEIVEEQLVAMEVYFKILIYRIENYE